MRSPLPTAYLNAAGWTLLAAIPPLLLWHPHLDSIFVLDADSFVFWRSVAEAAIMLTAMLIFAIGYGAMPSARNGALVLLGVAFLGVGLLQFMHVLSHPGTPDVLHKATFFDLASRLLAASALLSYTLLQPVRGVSWLEKRLAVALMLAVVGALGYVGLFQAELLSALSATTRPGPPPPRRTLGWLVLAVSLTTIVMLWIRRQKWALERRSALGFAAALLAASELLFTQQNGPGAVGAGTLGELYRIAASLYLLHAVFSESLRYSLERMTRQQRREKMVFDAAPDGILWVNQHGRILLANPAMETLSGYPVHELVGQNVDLFLPPHLRAQHAQLMRNYFITPHARAMGSIDLKLLRRDGRMLPVDISLGHWENENEKHAIAYIRDLTERKRLEESLRHQATHDELTGLPNRWLFRLQLNQALAHAKRTERHVATLVLDLDDFKMVNDSFGHLTGDELLVQVSRRLRSILRENDTLARLGGDEFAILLADMTTTEEAMNVAAKLLLSLEAPYRLQHQDVYASGSVGLALFPDDAQDSESLLRYADMAMYQAKQSGRNAYVCYSAEMDQRAHDNMQLHTRLKEAIGHRRLRLLYQPQVDIASGAIVGAEALLRWHDETLGDVPPARFIPIAETTGLILPLSEWVLETACQQIALWAQAGTPLRVAVNFSAQQFRLPSLPEIVAATLKRTGAQAQWLEIEITESVAMSQPVQAREQLDALVALGCSIVLDDFGTGYSSLAYLKALPVSKLKIDRDFIKDIPHDLNDVKISKSIIALAHSLGLTLVAEGVEIDEQLEFLRHHGCETYQGWLFAKALEASDLTSRLQGFQVLARSPELS